MSTSTSSTEAARNDTRFFGHPLPLMQLFSLELWERFSYYGMNGILAIYLYFQVSEGGLGMPQPTAIGIVGAYGGAVFLATILGAWIADRILGAERILFYSAIIIMVGHICLALIPGFGGVAAGLILVALGSGGLKANASALVGELYSEKDPRRDAGFTLFYMGVNIGAFLGPLITGLLQKEIGFHFGFGAAAVGMALGLIIYATGRKNLPNESRGAVNPLPASKLSLFLLAIVVAVVLIVVLWFSGVVNPDNLDWWIAGISAGAAACYFIVMYVSPQTNADERSRVLAFIPFFVTCVVFWSLYQQIFGTLTAYSDTQMNRVVFGWEMPINWLQLIPPIFVIAFAPVFSAIWFKLGTRQISTPVKAGLSLILIGIAFLLFLPFADAGEHETPLLWVAFILLLFVFAELLISPIGLSFSSKVAPKVFQSQMIAVFFLASGVGTALSGVLGGYYSADNQTPYWTSVGAASIVLGLLALTLTKPMLTMLRGIR
ncbi:peptide MFS transporter [Brevibacterium sandarakinum]|uniref:peptide MFS transporter n=1 Tax=Brevibacterium sandarakinum TaxID=629680 RepID=UPI00264F1524|nr:oligopeptide:H+ symporter [Brevibacterium sandarakinum]MDN5657442.1 oligopeptide:H+ symporter [Brevibacterium sandarakinum]